MVVTSRQQYDDPSVRLPEFERVGKVDIVRVSGTHFGRHSGVARMFDYVSFVQGARKTLKRVVTHNTIVVAKTDPPMLGMFLYYTVRSRGGVLVNWLQDLFPETLLALYPHSLVRLAVTPLRRMRNRSLTRAAVNVVIGQRMRKYLMAEGIHSDRIRVIPNWGHVDYEDENSTPDFKTKWGLKGKFVVGHFGNLGRAHEYETILGAMMAVEAADTHIMFLFVGGGSLLEKLKAGLAEHNLHNVVCRNYVPRKDLPAALRAVDAHLVILQPALEGFVVPSKFAGALAAGRPVLYLGDRTGEVGRQVQRRKCGQVIEIGNSGALAEAVRALAGDPATAAAQGEAAARVYQKYYRPNALFGQWRTLLNDLARKAD